MLKNYLTVAVRNLVRHRGYSAINVLGLAVGMACFFLIFLQVEFERSYDRFHEKADRIYRVIRQVRGAPGDEVENRANTGPVVAPLLRGEFPMIEHVVRVGESGGLVGLVRYGEKRFVEPRFFFADSNAFDVFTFPLLKGNPRTALKEPFSVVLTEEMARKYFRDEDPLGKVLIYQNRHRFTVTGVLKEIPPNAHFRFDFLGSFSSAISIWGRPFATHWDNRVWTYITLRAGTSPDELERLLPGFARRHLEKSSYSYVGLKLQPLRSIYLMPNTTADVGPRRNPGFLVGLLSLAGAILLISCINFVNLSTARSSIRAREVGVRKVVGGQRTQLILQFLGESVFMSLLAFLLALGLVEILMPTFKGLVGREVGLRYLEDPGLLISMSGIAVLVGLLSGCYPAFFLSAFDPVRALKGGWTLRSASLFRRGLVVFQFALSIWLIISTAVMYRQQDFLRHRDLGFDKEHVIAIPVLSARQHALFKQNLTQNPRILGVTASSNKPGVTDENGISLRFPGSKGDMGIGIIYIDFDYMKTLGLELAEGRDFSAADSSDARRAFWVSQSALKKLGWASGTGQSLELFFKENNREIPMYSGTVIGVIKDFNYRPLSDRPHPLVFKIAPNRFNYTLIRIRPGQIPETVDFIKGQWERLFPDWPFRFSFLDADIDRVYRSEKQAFVLFGHFAALGIFISCLGLLGLAAYAAERRTKEIGVRKVLGASVANIVTLLSKEFVILVGVANLIAWPVAYYAMSLWLQDFAYRIELGPGVFVAGGMLALIIALLTVSAQAVKAARANPVEALRYE